MRYRLRLAVSLVSAALPWRLRRALLQAVLGYKLHPTAHLGFALVAPRRLVMEAGARIGHGTVCKGVDLLHLGEQASIGRGNWITATPLDDRLHYRTELRRSPHLLVEKHAAITHRHLIDCTGGVRIGSFAILAGFRSQVLTHSIEIVEGRQRSGSISIGSYSFVGTDCVLLPGSALPDHCVLGAKSLLDKRFSATHTLYAGVPARPVKAIPADAGYFNRTVGFVP